MSEVLGRADEEFQVNVMSGRERVLRGWVAPRFRLAALEVLGVR